MLPLERVSFWPRWPILPLLLVAVMVVASLVGRSLWIGVLAVGFLLLAATQVIRWYLQEDWPDSLHRLGWKILLAPENIFGVESLDGDQEITEVLRTKVLPNSVTYRVRSKNIGHSFKVLEGRRGSLYKPLGVREIEVEDGSDGISVTFIGKKSF